MQIDKIISTRYTLIKDREMPIGGFMKKKFNEENSKKGFTLIELLAVITIMGILMLISIPAINKIIDNARKNMFVETAKSYAGAARTLWATDGLTCNGVTSSNVADGDYYILINTKENARPALPVLLEQGGKSSWGERDVNGYVRVNVSTIPGEDTNGDGIYEVQPKRDIKFYVALSDGTHALIDDGNLTFDNLVRGNVKTTLSEEDLKKVELTVDDGRLDCAKDESGVYSCTAVTPVKDITGVCVDEHTSVGITGRIVPVSFSTDEWNTIITALRSGDHPYKVGDTKTIDMGSLGTHTLRIANLSTPSECSGANFSQTACGTVLEFADIITTHNPNLTSTNVGGWPATEMRRYINNDIYSTLPSELQSIIIDTKVISGHGSTVGETNFISTDKIYLLSPTEIWAEGQSNPIANDTAGALTKQLDYYKKLGVTTSNFFGAAKQYNGSNYYWSLRTAYSAQTGTFYYVENNGLWKYYYAHYNSYGVSPAFRIA